VSPTPTTATTGEGQAAFTKPLFENLLAKEWLPGAPEIHERLLADPPARVVDVATSAGADDRGDLSRFARKPLKATAKRAGWTGLRTTSQSCHASGSNAFTPLPQRR
jgi:hypothetical protein